MNYVFSSTPSLIITYVLMRAHFQTYIPSHKLMNTHLYTPTHTSAFTHSQTHKRTHAHTRTRT